MRQGHALSMGIDAELCAAEFIRPGERPAHQLSTLATMRNTGPKELETMLKKTARGFLEGSWRMDLAQEYRKHAEDCRRAARGTRDLESKAQWNALAERWSRCAEHEASRQQPPHVSRHRRESKFRYAQAS